MASSKEETYCLCGQPYTVGQFMIECDCCREWFHGSCVNVRIYQSDDIDKYHCPKCSQTYGPSVLKVPTNDHRQDRYEVGAETKQPQIGSPAWTAALARRPLRPRPNALLRLHPQQFNEDFIKDNGFTRPVFFNTIYGLDIQVPNPSSFTVRSVLRFCGSNQEIEVIDVRKQSNFRMTLGEFVDYFESPPSQRDGKVLNVLSLEFSETTMTSVVKAPAIVRRLDWARNCCPTSPPIRPSVAHYCLVSPANAYTDFHVDFGGTSVWYHVLHGKKIFYLIQPTTTNLALYQQWNTSHNQSEKFFADLCEWYTTVEVNAGETLFIPGGWIHAVFTPEDSLVFGGNFLHSYAIEMQLQINEIEQRVETPMAFRYPLFETMNWYAAKYLLAMLTRYNDDRQDEDFAPNDSWQWSLPALLIRGLKILAPALKEWHALRSTNQQKKNSIPNTINSGQLVRDLFKELKRLEKLNIPGKPEKHKDPTFKSSSSKSKKKRISNQLKPLKLTLPKPIMHNISNERLEYAAKSEPYYEDQRVYAAEEDYERKSSVLRMRLDGYPSSSHVELPPPPAYSLPEHSILKSHLIGDPPKLTPHIQTTSINLETSRHHISPTGHIQTTAQHIIPSGHHIQTSGHHIQTSGHHIQTSGHHIQTSGHHIQTSGHHIQTSGHHIPTSGQHIVHQQWTISKHGEQEQTLFTNENNIQQVNYGPGMYSADDVQDNSFYAEPQKYAPDYSNTSYQDIQAAYHQIDYSKRDSSHHHAQHHTDPYTVHQEYSTPAHGGVTSPVPSAPPAAPYTPALPPYESVLAAANNIPYSTSTPQPLEHKQQSPSGVRRSERAVRRRHSPSYHYDSDTPLFIDETPPAKKRQKNSAPVYPRAAANGIESLIQASQLTAGARLHTENAAVAGMLSIGRSQPVTPKKKPKRDFVSSDEEMLDDSKVIKEVHRDDEYVYPSLEMSSDEDEYDHKAARRKTPRNNESKKDKDESWSPRARVGRLVPRSRRPARAGTRREAVRAALHHAATHTPTQHHKPVKISRPVPPPRPAPRPPPQPSNLPPKPRKGMKTAKQRLGKILKIHKMRM